MGIQLTGSLNVTGSVTASLGFFGKSNGIVTPINVVSNTASLDLQVGNFYTLQLVSGSTIFVNATNIQAGQFSLLEVSTVSQSAITFSDNIIQGSPPYTPTQLSSKDLLSFSSFNSSSAILSQLAGNFGLIFPIATGGTITTSGSYKIHEFTSSVDFTITNAVTTYPFEYFIVAAGGNGGSSIVGSPFYDGGGAGSGTVRTGTTNITTTGSTAFPVTIGLNASSRTSTWNSISATGGNDGENAQASGGSAGPGDGGSNADFSAGSPSSPNGGGGAGSSANGSGITGGAGTTSTISGTSVTYAVGGSGNGSSSNQKGSGGAPNTGGGAGTLGKDGIVYIKYQYTS
jgi:hypothetical protein